MSLQDAVHHFLDLLHSDGFSHDEHDQALAALAFEAGWEAPKHEEPPVQPVNAPAAEPAPVEAAPVEAPAEAAAEPAPAEDVTESA